MTVNFTTTVSQDGTITVTSGTRNVGTIRASSSRIAGGLVVLFFEARLLPFLEQGNAIMQSFLTQTEAVDWIESNIQTFVNDLSFT